MNKLDTNTMGGKRGAREALGSQKLPLELAGPVPLPSGARESSCLDYIQTKVCVCFLVFLLGAAVLGLTTSGQAVLSGAAGAGKGHPGVILGTRLPRIQHAPFIISLHVHSVSCSEVGGAPRPSH